MSDDMRIKQLEAENAELKRRLGQESHLTPYESSVEITTCILAYNAWTWLPYVLNPLWVQDVRMDLLTYMDDASIDPTEDILAGPRLKWLMEHHQTKGVREYRYLGKLPHRPNVEQIVAHACGNFVSEAKTPFVFFLQDVVLQAGWLRLLLDDFKSDPEAGAVGIPYDMVYDHVPMGALLMRTDVAKEVKFWPEPRCVCTSLAKSLAEKKLTMRFWKHDGRADHRHWTNAALPMKGPESCPSCPQPQG